MANVLPLKILKKTKTEYWLRLLALTLTFLGVTAGLVAATFFPSHFLLQEKIANLENTRSFVEQAQEKREDNTALQELSAFKRLLSELRAISGKERVTAVLRNTIGRLPSGVTVERIFFRAKEDDMPGELVIGGVASSRAVLREFADSLRNIPGVSEVTLPVSNLAAESNITYSLTLNGSW